MVRKFLLPYLLAFNFISGIFVTHVLACEDQRNIRKTTSSSLPEGDQARAKKKARPEREEASINTLQPETLILMFSFLETRQNLINVSLVSKLWNDLSKDKTLLSLRALKESRLPTKSLIYAHGSTHFDHYTWSFNTLKVLKKFTKKLQEDSSLKTLNIVFARLNLIYEQNNEVTSAPELKEASYMIPKFFMSRWPTSSDRDKIKKGLAAAKHLYRENIRKAGEKDSQFPQVNDYNSYHIGTAVAMKRYPEYVTFRTHLEKVISLEKGKASQLDKNRLDKHLAFITQTKEEKDRDEGQFYHKFFHGEQGVILRLNEGMDLYLLSLLKEVKASSKIVSVILDLVSYWDMCERCGDTLFREIEEGKVFFSKLIGKLTAKNFLIDKIKLFISCASLEAYPDDDGSFLRDRKDLPIVSQHGNVINLEGSNQFIAQYYQAANAKELNQW
jgi:hypothetical protein